MLDTRPVSFHLSQFVGLLQWPGLETRTKTICLSGSLWQRLPVMKSLFTLALTVVSMAAFATTTFAGSCGGCTDGEKKDKAKTEEGAQS